MHKSKGKIIHVTQQTREHQQEHPARLKLFIQMTVKSTGMRLEEGTEATVSVCRCSDTFAERIFNDSF